MSNSHRHTLVATASVSILFAISSGCRTTYVGSAPSSPPQPTIEHAPPPHEPVYEHHRRFTYVHYPSCNVYHDHERRVWFWMEGHEWKMGAELPARFHIDIGEGVKIELDNETPYEAAPAAPPRQVIVHEAPHAPMYEHGRTFTYVHYPSCNVYRDHERKLWFWLEGHEWRMGAELPARFHIDEREGRKIELDSETPHEIAPSAPPRQVVVHEAPHAPVYESPRAPGYEHGRTFTYVHYPSCNVYRDHERKLWFWLEGHDWKTGAELPARFRIDEREGVKFELDAETPYEHENSGKGQGKGKKS